MKKCVNCLWLDYYPPTHRYERAKDGMHRCYLAGARKVNIHKDEEDELKNESLQHVCLYKPCKLPIQLELDFK